MKTNDLESRREHYFKLSSEIAQIDDTRLRAVFDAAEPTNGWGRNHVLEVGGEKVFVKRVPLTDLEYENGFSTRNLYSLPAYYNYGVGSAGFGVFRELVANIKVTNWVLGGEIETFPLMYHYRICRASGANGPVDLERHEGYVKYWNGNENIGRYILDRASARYEMVLFIEYVPAVLHGWLKEHAERTEDVLGQLVSTIDFLRAKGLIHFDAHFQNILVDEDRPYLTDFGLVLDESFELGEDEQELFRTHSNYDYAQIFASFDYVVEHRYDALSPEEKLKVDTLVGLDETVTGNQRRKILVDNVGELQAKSAIGLDDGYVAALTRYRAAGTRMRAFFSELQGSDAKDAAFPEAELSEALKLAGISAA